MILLHTSDWHLGRSFHGTGLLEAQEEVLDALVAAGVLGDDAQVSRLLASKVYVEPGQWTGASVRVMTEINVKVPDVPGGVAHAGGAA